MGCSRGSIRSVDRSGREITEGRQEVALGTVQAKPSPCIEWGAGSARFSRPVRKAKAALIARDPQTNPQSKNQSP
jgi:hypothetical protein